MAEPASNKYDDFLDSDMSWEEYQSQPDTLVGKVKKVVTDTFTQEPKGEHDDFLDSDISWEEHQARPKTAVGKVKKVFTDIATPEPKGQHDDFLEGDMTFEESQEPSLWGKAKGVVSQLGKDVSELDIAGDLQKTAAEEARFTRPPETIKAEGYVWDQETGELKKPEKSTGLVGAVESAGEGVEALGSGVTHGTLGLAESGGTALQYLGNRMQTPAVVGFGLLSPTQKKWVVERRQKLIDENIEPELAMEFALVDRAIDEARTSKEGAESLREQGKLIEQFWGDQAKKWEAPEGIKGKNVWDNPELLGSPLWWLYNIGEMAPSMAATIVPAMGTGKGITLAGSFTRFSKTKAGRKLIERIARMGSASVGGTMGGGLEATGTYRAVLAKGGTEPEAKRAAELMGFFAAGLNAIGLDRILKKAGPGFAKKVANRFSAGVAEGVTEGLEEPAEVVAKVVSMLQEGKEVPDDIMDMFSKSLKDMVTVMPIAFFMGATASGGADMAMGSEQQQKVEESRQTIQEIDKAGPTTGEMLEKAPVEEAPSDPTMAKAMGEEQRATDRRIEEPVDLGEEERREGERRDIPTKGELAIEGISESKTEDAVVQPEEGPASEERRKEDIGVPPETDQRKDERRKDFERRKDVSKLTRDELEKEILFNEKLGIPTIRKFEEEFKENPPTHVARVDINSLHDINKILTYEGGDAVIKALADTAIDENIPISWEKGDEFVSKGSETELETNMNALKKRLLTTRVTYTTPDGKEYRLDGVGIGFGIAKVPQSKEYPYGDLFTALDQAEEAVNVNKAKQQEAGERVERGEGGVVGLAEVAPTRREVVDKDTTKAEKTEIEPKAPKEKLSETRTLRGAIKKLGGINFLNYKGELKSMDQNIKRLSKKSGVPIDTLVDQLKDDNWLPQDATVTSFLEDLRVIGKDMLSRDRITREVGEKKEYEKTVEEKRIEKEMAHEPDAPPRGKYVQMNAKDLPKGKKLTLIEAKSPDGWDVYEVKEKTPFKIVLQDGVEVELKPNDKVEALQKNLPKKKVVTPAKKPEKYAVKKLPAKIVPIKKPKERKSQTKKLYDDVKILLSKSLKKKAVSVTLADNNKAVFIKSKNGHVLMIESVENIVPGKESFGIGYSREKKPGEIVAGSYHKNVVKISAVGDKWTIAHEMLGHWMEDAGLINKRDIRVLKSRVKALHKAGKWETQNKDDIGGSEDRAEFVSQQLKSRSEKGLVASIIQKIADFIDGIINLLPKMKTALGIVKSIETGRVFEGKGGKKTSSRFAQDPLMSQTDAVKDVLDNKDFNEWFKDSRLVDSNGNPVVVYQGEYYSKTAGRWYSQMTDFLSDKLSDVGRSHQIKATLASWAKKGQIKAEELEWSGLNEFLSDKKGKVTKQEILDYLAENHVQIQEVVKGERQKLNDDDLAEALSDIYGTVEISGDDVYVHHDQNAEDTDAGWNTISRQDARDVIKERRPKELDTKFKQYTLPGGKGYKEILLTMPYRAEEKELNNNEYSQLLYKKNWNDLNELQKDKVISQMRVDEGIKKTKDEYKASHWDEPNVLAHIRMQEVTDKDGKKTLLIEEIQSDWHQEGRKKGYREYYTKDELNILPDEDADVVGDTSLFWFIEAPNQVFQISKKKYATAQKALDYVLNEKTKTSGVPDAPFKKAWPVLAFKRMVRMAAEQNFDQIAWTPGEVQADRYDLSKQISRVKYTEYDDYDLFLIWDKDTKLIVDDRLWHDKLNGDQRYQKVEDTIGKELAKKIWDGEDDISGIDLKVGGEGMKAFYDKMLPSAVKKFFGKKAWGSPKVGTTEIDTGEGGYRILDRNGEELEGPFKTKEEAEKKAEEYGADFSVREPGKEIWILQVTPEMKSKSLREGMPMFQVKKLSQPSAQDALPLGDDIYTAARKVKKNTSGNAWRDAKYWTKEFTEGVDKYLGAISTRVGNISQKIRGKLRKLDMLTSVNAAKDVEKVMGMLEKTRKKMSKDDALDWSYARLNGDTEKINELKKKYDLEKEYASTRKTLTALREKGLDVGLDIGWIDEYAPRYLKDKQGFLAAVGKGTDWPVYEELLKKAAANMGLEVSDLTPDMQADLISNMIAYGPQGLGSPAATKKRQIKQVGPLLSQYYYDSDSALVRHIYDMHTAIEIRKFFGKVPEKIAEAKRNMNKSYRELVKLRRSGKDKQRDIEGGENSPRMQTLKDNIKMYRSMLNAYKTQRDFTGNIGQYTMDLLAKGEIDARQQNTLHEILTARFHQVGARGLVKAYKNISYIDTMGSYISAVTQLGDLAWSLYDAGFYLTVKHGSRAAAKQALRTVGLKKIAPEMQIAKKDIGVDRIAQEFADADKLSNAVAMVFKAVGIEQIDAIGKETLMNAALEKYQKQAKKNPKRLAESLQPVFESETESLIQDLQSKEISYNVKLLIYNKLADFQPIGLSEMPQKYLTAGNGRIFYMLKTFTLKQFDVYRREVFQDLRHGNKKEKVKALGRFIRLSAIFALANASADEIKDWMLGRKTDLNDRVWDNILRLMGISKFVTWKGRTEGWPMALMQQVLPPTKFLTAVGKDLYNMGDGKGLEMFGSVPLVGKLWYWHMGRGTSKRKDLWDVRWSKQKKKLRKIQERYELSKNKEKFRREHRKELTQHAQMSQMQGVLNTYTKRINQLKSQEQTELTKKRIKKLKSDRQQAIEKMLGKLHKPW